MSVCAGLSTVGLTQRSTVQQQALYSECFSPWWSQAVLSYGGAYSPKKPLLFGEIYFLYLCGPELLSSKASCLLMWSSHLEWIWDFQLAIQFRLLEAKEGLLYNWWVPGLTLTLLLVFLKSPCNSNFRGAFSSRPNPFLMFVVSCICLPRLCCYCVLVRELVLFHSYAKYSNRSLANGFWLTLSRLCIYFLN